MFYFLLLYYTFFPYQSIRSISWWLVEDALDDPLDATRRYDARCVRDMQPSHAGSRLTFPFVYIY